MPLLGKNFHVHAIDVRGHGRSTRTPGRYTLDNMGNDLVRFLDGVIGRPAVVSGLSSGGGLAAWLSVYAKPGQLMGAHCEDPPFFSSELTPVVGQSIRQCLRPQFALFSTCLGDQRGIGDWAGTVGESCPHHRMLAAVEGAGQPITYQTHPTMGHSMPGQDPDLFAGILTDWAATL